MSTNKTYGLQDHVLYGLQDHVFQKCHYAAKMCFKISYLWDPNVKRCWCINNVSLSGCAKLMVAVRAGGTAETRETVATAAVTEAGAEAATTAVVVAAAAVAMTAVAATTVAAEADLLVWGKSHCATAPLRYLNVLWKMMRVIL